MLHPSNPKTDNQLKERILFQEENLYYGAYLATDVPQFHGDILWHWHDEFEFGYVAEGSILYKSNQHEYVLHKGDGIFINARVPHYLHPLSPLAKTKLHTQFFDKVFLGGYDSSPFDLKYIQPIIEQKEIDLIPFYSQNTIDQFVLSNLQKAIRLAQAQTTFFEFRIRNLFSSIWEMIYTQAMEHQMPEIPYNDLEDERIKQMLSFIEASYSEKLTVTQIAKSIPVSERECFRLFQNTLGMSPTEFLISFRLKKARELLITTQKDILEIAVECGFNNSSYFGKLFKQQYQLSPGDYRKEQQERSVTNVHNRTI